MHHTGRRKERCWRSNAISSPESGDHRESKHVNGSSISLWIHTIIYTIDMIQQDWVLSPTEPYCFDILPNCRSYSSSRTAFDKMKEALNKDLADVNVRGLAWETAPRSFCMRLFLLLHPHAFPLSHTARAQPHAIHVTHPSRDIQGHPERPHDGVAENVGARGVRHAQCRQRMQY